MDGNSTPISMRTDHTDRSAVRFGVLTVSDTCFSNPSQDISGSTAVDLLRQHGFTFILQSWVPDDSMQIQAVLSSWIGSTQVDVIVTTGGTGITARDVTTETVLRLLHDGRRLSGLEHALYAVSLRHTPMAALSRLVAGVIGNVLIVTLPGSPRAVSECIPVIYPIVKHAVDQIKGLSTGHSRNGLNSAAFPMRSCTNSKVRRVADRPRESPFPMTSVKEAQAKIFGIGVSMLAGLQVEAVFYQNALGRVLGCSLKSQVCIPPYDASVMDGYAVRFSDQCHTLRVLGALCAGDSLSTDHLVVSTGTCVRVNTGGPLPLGADAVVPVEHTRLVSGCNASSADLSAEESVIEVSSPPTHSGQFIRPAGSDLTTENVFKRGLRLNSADLGVLAGAGLLTPFSSSETSRFLADNQNKLLPPAVMSVLCQGGYLPCIKQPCIGILSTGNELVDGLGSPGPLSILDSNRPVLMGLLRKHGFVNLLDLGIAKDHEGALENAFRHAFDRCDIVVATGGMSMGEQDLVASVLTDRFGAVMHFSRVRMKPGKPTKFASVPYQTSSNPQRSVLVFCLPGNPVSAFVTAHLFVLPLLRLLELRPETEWCFPSIRVRLLHAVSLGDRPDYRRARLIWKAAPNEFVSPSLPCATCDHLGSQVSSRLMSCSDSDLLLVLPEATSNLSNLAADSVVDAIWIGT
ncbi:hypothetical protein EG68_06944 [Paragonimus skrjabini miyazakii]|uniref:MoaB/Mog domain-containing protein n=1 Tax=Paragonimus skrjabini miyazakii TaxID=59628 RepID=A0A8S9YSB9_9TREM|nr:hypothetical protein EG68_06944 [Paragonimus skrjabini miyazakii]